MLTKGNFTRDSWDHLLRWLYIMNFSMFSCSHFLSNRKQSVMSKRAQERGTEEGPPVAKPRPMSLVSRSAPSAKDTSSIDSGASDSSQDPTKHSQECQQDDKSCRGARKLVQSGECESSGSTRKPVRGIDNQLERTRLEYHFLQISDNRYVEKVFRNLRQ